MKTQCPTCKEVMDVEETQKDQNVTCAFCGNEFKAKAYESQEEKYNKAVTNLWIAVGLSIVNLVLILAGSSWNFAFSLWGSEMLCEFGGVGVTFAIILLIVYGILAFLAADVVIGQNTVGIHRGTAFVPENDFHPCDFFHESGKFLIEFRTGAFRAVHILW